MSTTKWEKLLSSNREGSDDFAQSESQARSEFFRDYDRIIFSSAFRRLKDKTQVFPLAKSDYVRTRLTHSLEVASVGRSLGFFAGTVIADKGHLPAGLSSNDTATIVATACLAHDIGNPPFGHAGEAAIQEWFANDGLPFLNKMSDKEALDFRHFEGNAQGFRILSTLQHPGQEGGLRLTMAVRGTITKYPRESFFNKPKDTGKSGDKFGFMKSESESFEALANSLGLVKKSEEGLAWHRHPFAFLVEAADDICYNIIDVEDGFKDGLISYDELERLHEPWIEVADTNKLDTLVTNNSKAEYLRAKLIDKIVSECVAVFAREYYRLLEGTFDAPLVEHIESRDAFSRFKESINKNIYSKREILELESAGFKVIGSLLSAFLNAAEESSNNQIPTRTSSMKLLELLKKSTNGPLPPTPYRRAQIVTDFVSGMTDSYALNLYQRIAGISLA
jgi:dGTPase